MAKPVPVEVRQRIVEAFDRGNTREEIAEFFNVGTASITRFLTRRRETGSLEPSPRPGRPPLLDEQAGAQMREWLKEQSDLTLGELRERLEAAGCMVKKSAIGEALKRMGLVRKKKRCARPSATVPMCGSRGRNGPAS